MHFRLPYHAFQQVNPDTVAIDKLWLAANHLPTSVIVLITDYWFQLRVLITQYDAVFQNPPTTGIKYVFACRASREHFQSICELTRDVPKQIIHSERDVDKWLNKNGRYYEIDISKMQPTGTRNIMLSDWQTGVTD